MGITEPNSHNIRCRAKTLKGKPCKNAPKQGHEFCWRHCLSRTTDARWYQNSVLQMVLGVVATMVFGFLYFHLGPTKEKQDEGLGLQRIGLVLQTNSMKQQEATGLEIHQIGTIMRTNVEARTRAVPSLPLITITTMRGLPPERSKNPHLRLHQLIVRNTSEAEIDQLYCRVQLPEPIIETLTTNHPVGSSIGWRPLLTTILPVEITPKERALAPTDAFVIPSRYGMTHPPYESFTPKKTRQQTEEAVAFRSGDLPGVWELSIDKLPPSGNVLVEFLTSNGDHATNYMMFTFDMPYGRYVPPPDTNRLKFYIEGEYWYQGDNKPSSQYFLVPISFDASEHRCVTLPVQADVGQWHPALVHQISGFFDD